MAIKFREQAAKVGQLLTSSTTYKAYRDALVVTWELLKEIAILGWYAVLLLLVLIDWILSTGRKVVFDVRNWVNEFDKDSQDAGKIASQAGKSLASASQSSLKGLVSQARNQLGLPERSEPELVIPVKEPQAEAVPVAATPASVTPTAPIAAPEPTAPSGSNDTVAGAYTPDGGMGNDTIANP